MAELSQEEIELLMGGMLSEEESQSIFESKTEEVEESESAESEAEAEKSEAEESELIDMENADDFFKEEIKDSEVSKEKKKNKFIEKIQNRIKLFKDSAALKNKKAVTEGNTEAVTEENKKAVTEENKEAVKEENTEAVKEENTEAVKEEKKEEDSGFPVESSVKNNNALLGRLDKIPLKLLFKFLIGLVLLVIIMALLFLNQVYKKNQLVSIAKTTVSVPVYKANTTNYIFISKKKQFKEGTLELVKMLIDPVATLFYFDKPMDLMLYEATLKDENGKSYNMDISFSSSKENEEVNYIRFQPMDEGVKEFTLSISDLKTGDHVTYPIVLKSYPNILPAKLLPQPIMAKDSDPSMQLILENAVFSGAGSYVEYRLDWKDSSETIQSGWKDIPHTGMVEIKEKDDKLIGIKEYPSVYDFENHNTVLGRMDFQNVKNLNSTVDIVFKNLYKQKTVAEKLDLTSIIYKGSQYEDEDNYKTIDLGKYKLVLERFGVFGENSILVYHVEDVVSKLRVETSLVANLVISDDSGMEVVIEGKYRTKQEAGNIEFNTKNSKEVLEALNNKKYTIHLTNVGIKMPDQSFTIDLSQLDDTKIQVDKLNVKEFVLEGFKKRLSVKSGETDQKELEKYFKDYILKEEVIIRDYLQPSTLVGPADYTSQIITMGKNDDDTYYAVVQDYWKGNEGIKESRFYRTHKIIIESIAGSFIVTEDIIIK